MKNEKNKLLGVFSAFVILLLLMGCGSGAGSANTTEEDTQEAEAEREVERITVATVNDYPPFEYLENDELTGFDVDIVEAIARLENIEVEWNVMKWDGVIPALQGKQVDAAVGAMSITEERLEAIDFSDTYFNGGAALVVLKDSPISELENLEGKIIVAKQGTSGLMKANELAEEYNAEVRILQDDVSLFLETESGNVDAMVNDFPSVAYKLKTDGENAKLEILGDPLTSEDYGIGISKGNEELVEKINRGLKTLQESGEYQEIFDKYFSS